MNKKKNSICAVVITHNRKKLLLKCLKALLIQTHSLDSILIIDNASNDGTENLLKDNKFISKMPKSINKPFESQVTFKANNIMLKIIYVKMHQNKGGAGGFHEGIKRGYEKGYDWLWVMDDDAEPAPNALETLVNSEYFNKSFVGALACGVYLPDGSMQITHHQKINFLLQVHPAITDNDNADYVFLDANSFVGLLIKRIAIECIGLPRDDLFIWGDDTDFTFRLSRHFKLVLLPNSRITHYVLGENYEKIKKFGFYRLVYGYQSILLRA